MKHLLGYLKLLHEYYVCVIQILILLQIKGTIGISMLELSSGGTSQVGIKDQIRRLLWRLHKDYYFIMGCRLLVLVQLDRNI